jgi:hypothetical protein
MFAFVCLPNSSLTDRITKLVFYINDNLYLCSVIKVGVSRWRSWLKHCATSRKDAGSISDCAIGIFHRHNPGVVSTSNRNKHQEYFAGGVRAAGA